MSAGWDLDERALIDVVMTGSHPSVEILRRELGAEAVQTVRGMGYRLPS